MASGETEFGRMGDSEIKGEAENLLVTKIFGENEIVTTRTLSQELRINNMDSQRELESFLNKYQDKCVAKYMITGYSESQKDRNMNGNSGAHNDTCDKVDFNLLVKLVSASELKDTINSTRNPIVALYSIQSSDNNIDELNQNEKLLQKIKNTKIEDYESKYLVKTPNIMSINFTEANFKQEEAKDNKKIKVAEINPLKNKSASTKVGEAEDKKTVLNDAKGKNGVFFKAKSLPETKIQASEAPTLKEKTPTKPSGVKKIPAKHKNEKDTQEKSKAQESMSKGVEHQPLNVESSEELEEEIKKSPKKLLKRKVISDSSESEDETGISSPKTMNENKIQDSEAAAGNKPKSRIRKTRKIMKTKHFKNDRGMMVTKVVEEIESYSESEPDMPSHPKMAVTPTTHGNNTSKTASIPTKSKSNTANLMNFFAKKK